VPFRNSAFPQLLSRKDILSGQQRESEWSMAPPGDKLFSFALFRPVYVPRRSPERALLAQGTGDAAEMGVWPKAICYSHHCEETPATVPIWELRCDFVAQSTSTADTQQKPASRSSARVMLFVFSRITPMA
jgi:hypothetical protein